MKRRDFIKRNLLAALGGASLYGQFGNLKVLQAAALDSSTAKGGSDYKALVCLFLNGGNDNINTIIPRDNTTYARYSSARPELAIPQAELTAATHITPNTAQSDGRQYALHPSLSEIRNLFEAQRCAIVANVGPLIEPVTRTQYQTGSVAVPPQLFSHNDQQVFWQTSRPDSTQKIGWAGRIADLLQSQNTNQSLSMSLSLAGQNTLQTGSTVQPYSISANGAEERAGYFESWNSERRAAVDALLDASHSHILERAVSGVQRRSIDLYQDVSNALAGVPDFTTPVPTLEPGFEGAQETLDRLVGDLRMVARMIAAQSTLGQRRQVFFVDIGGWDFHDRLIFDQANQLRAVSLGVQMFQDIIANELPSGMDQQITTFTASDFGRTMTANGDGTDHGWGGEHFVIGGAVNGREIYGDMPALMLGSEEDAGWGQIIPKLAVDQYAATLARWFGVTESNIDMIFPLLGEFPAASGGFVNTYRDLGFMQPG